MIVRVLSGSLFFFVLVFSNPTGPFATPLDGKTDAPTGRPRNTSDLNLSYPDTSTTFVSSLNRTGVALENGGIPGAGEEEKARTDPNVRDDDISDNKRTHEDKDSTMSIARNSNASESDSARSANNYTRDVVDTSTAVDTSTSSLITPSLTMQQDLETRRIHDESTTTTTTTAAGQDMTGKHREQLQTGSYSSVTLDNASAASSSHEKNYTNRTTSSTIYTGSSTENILEKNENTHPSRKTTGMPELVSITYGPAGKLVERTGPEPNVSKVTPAVVPASPDFKTETKLAGTSGRAADDHVTQTDDVRNWKRDVNSPTPLEVTKLEFAYKSLWEDVEDTEADDGKMESDGGGGWSGGTSRNGIAGGSAGPEGTGKRMGGKKDEEEEVDGRFTISAELRKARDRNEHFSLSFHGVPWREELNILVPVLCGMFGAMILVLAAYFLRNCPNNIRRLARMSRPSKMHRRKSDLNLLIDNSSGDEHP